MTTPKHSPLPWKVLNGEKNGHYTKIIDAEGLFVTTLTDIMVGEGDNDELNGSFIIEACNSHYELKRKAEVAKEMKN